MVGGGTVLLMFILVCYLDINLRVDGHGACLSIRPFKIADEPD